ncbi:MAG: class I SAM-dependent methyltransferase [Candidatus Altiarchaeota archaeon]|nr:class I SAM-dependent methyltransferase [Candidatus Altiarchaeota archaeon]
MMHERDYWDEVSLNMSGHHLETGIALYKRQQHIRLIEEWTEGKLSNSSVLKTDGFEEAFGGDFFSDFLLEKTKKTFLIDISKVICEKTKTHFPALNVITASVTAVPLKNSSIDIVISNSTLDHLNTSDVETALYELHRILSKNGLLILTLDNANNVLYKLGYSIKKKYFKGYHQEKCYYVEDIKPLLEKNGFAVDEIQSIVHIPTPINFILKWVSPIDKLLFRIPSTSLISFFDFFGRNGRNICSGWFLALKCVKK